MKERVDKEIVFVKNKLTELQQQKSLFKTYIQKEIPLLENLLEFYRKSNGTTKKKIPGFIFSEKLVLETRSEATKSRRAGRRSSAQRKRKSCNLRLYGTHTTHAKD
jgi:hypothetical protein